MNTVHHGFIYLKEQRLFRASCSRALSSLFVLDPSLLSHAASAGLSSWCTPCENHNFHSRLDSLQETESMVITIPLVKVGDEAHAGDIDDPWGLSGKSFKASKKQDDAAELAEPLPTILLEETLPVTPPELWLLVMGSSDLLKSVSKIKKNRELRIGRWRLSKGTDTTHELLAAVMDCATCRRIPQEFHTCAAA